MSVHTNMLFQQASSSHSDWKTTSSPEGIMDTQFVYDLLG